MMGRCLKSNLQQLKWVHWPRLAWDWEMMTLSNGFVRPLAPDGQEYREYFVLLTRDLRVPSDAPRILVDQIQVDLGSDFL